MSIGTLLERLFISIVADTSGLDQEMNAAADSVNGMTKRIGHDLARVGRDISSVGYMISATVTAPIAAAGVTLVKAAGDFQTSMIKVEQNAKATGAETQQLSDLARDLGVQWGFGAKAIADSMNDLVKNGHSVTDVLNGTIEATTILAKAAGSELGPAANIATDAMNNFGLSAGEMKDMANQVVGTLLQSKFELRDYQLAMGMAGAAAHNFGVDFKDFNATLSATASAFTSGSDAGTSFKVFLTRLTGTTKPAADAMAQYGLSFFDANGNMKDMATIADNLKSSLGGLDDETRNIVLKDIFGIDALRMGAALVEKGGDAIRNMRAEIETTNAAGMATAKSFGFDAALKELSASWQELGIAVGESGVLAGVTMLIEGLTGLVNIIGTLPAPIVAGGSALLVLVAAIGPLIAMVGGAVTAFGVFAELFAVGGIFASGGAMAGVGVILGDVALAFGALAGPVAAAVAICTAIYLVFKDQLDPAFKAIADYAVKMLKPAFEECFNAAKEVVASFGALWTAFAETEFGQAVGKVIDWLGKLLGAFAETIGTAITNILTALIRTFTTVFQGISNTLNVVSSLLRGEWGQAWKDFEKLSSDAIRGTVSIIQALFPTAVEAVAAMVNSIKDWIENKLSSIWDGAKTKIEEVKKTFFDLYDAVVGHSYIPDMVDGIGLHMRRLDGVMVDPAQRAAMTTSEAFAALAGEVATSMQVANDNVAQGAQQLGTSLTEPVNEATKQMQDRINSAVDAVKQQFSNLLDGGKFDIGDMLRDIVKGWGNAALEQIATWAKNELAALMKSIQEQMQGLGSGSGTGGWGNILASAWGGVKNWFSGKRAGGGPVLSNNAYIVGEKGPEAFVPNGSGRIIPNNQLGGGGGNVVNFNFPKGTDPERFRKSESQLSGMVNRFAGGGYRNR